MAKVTVGGKEYEVPEMNFLALERCWPHIEEAMTTLDPIKGPAAGIRIIAAGLIEADHFKPTDFGIGENETLGEDQTFERVTHFLKKKLKANEIEAVRAALDEITKEAGLEEAEAGEAPQTPQQEASPSVETAPTTSPSSSPPDAKEGAGS
jgi:hypothetical protein